MAGRFDGLSDLEWRLCADIFPTPSAGFKCGRCKPRATDLTGGPKFGGRPMPSKPDISAGPTIRGEIGRAAIGQKRYVTPNAGPASVVSKTWPSEL